MQKDLCCLNVMLKVCVCVKEEELTHIFGLISDPSWLEGKIRHTFTFWYLQVHINNNDAFNFFFQHKINIEHL